MIFCTSDVPHEWRSNMIWQKTGAQLLSLNWFNDSTQKLGPNPFYLSPVLNSDTPARGGVPVLFPQFADKGALQKHGYARNMPWVLDRDVRSADSHLVQLSLEVTKTTWPAWPFAAHLSLMVEQYSNPNDGLVVTLTIANKGDETFEFTGGLHPYFAIENPARFKLRGLEACPVRDKLDPSLREDSPAGPKLDGTELERLYLNPAPVQLEGGPLGTLTISTTGFTNWMVWNPGVELAKTIADLPDQDWASFVCVEPVIADKPMQLRVGETFTGTMKCQWR